MKRRDPFCAAAVAVALCVCGAAAAQGVGMSTGEEDETSSTTARSQQKDVRPPAPSDPGKPAIVVPYLLTFVLGGLAVGLAVMPSGRTHQD